jgi:hypothetical protein
LTGPDARRDDSEPSVSLERGTMWRLKDAARGAVLGARGRCDDTEGHSPSSEPRDDI